jgi:hypothetical protein
MTRSSSIIKVRPNGMKQSTIRIGIPKPKPKATKIVVSLLR